MAVYKADILDVELNTGNIARSFLCHNIGKDDTKADRFGVRVYRDGEPESLSGCSIQGYMMRPNGTNLAITGSNTGVSGNEAWVDLPQAAYDYEGQFCLALKLIGGGVTGTIRIIDGMINNTFVDDALVPMQSVPTYQEILAVYDQMVAAKNGSVRFDQSQSLTETQKSVARMNIDAANDSDVSDLKSALQADETFLGLNINKTSLWSAGTISSSTGATASASNNDKIRTGYIDRKIAFVEPESGYYVCIYAYDSNNNDSYVGCWDGTMYKTSIQRKYVRMNIGKIPLSYKVRLVFSKSDNTSISTDDSSHLIVSVFTDETLTTSGKPADAKITGDIINQNSEKNEYDFRSLMLDNYDTSLWSSGTINSSTGITAPANNKIRTGYISISDSKIVRVTPESGYYLYVFVYSSNTQESYLGNWTGSGYVSNLVKYTDVANINVIPKNYYIRIVGSKSNNSDMTSSDYSSFIFSKFKADDLEEKYDDLMGYYVDEGDPVD